MRTTTLTNVKFSLKLFNLKMKGIRRMKNKKEKKRIHYITEYFNNVPLVACGRNTRRLNLEMSWRQSETTCKKCLQRIKSLDLTLRKEKE